MIPGCRTPFDEILLLRRLTDEEARTGNVINGHTLADKINTTIDDSTYHVTANAIHMRLWRLGIPHTMEMPTPTPAPKPSPPKAESRPVRRVEYHPAPTSQAESRHDLLDLADMHKRAFNRLRALERKVATIQENIETYAESVGDWMCETVAILQSLSYHEPAVWQRVNEVADTLPHLKHEHVYEWNDGIGTCLCGYTVQHARRGTDDDLYRHSIGSTGNRYARRGY